METRISLSPYQPGQPLLIVLQTTPHLIRIHRKRRPMRFMLRMLIRSNSDATALEYQRLSAGTMYQGASSVLVFSKDLLPCVHIFVPAFTRLQIARIEFPILRRIVQPVKKMLLLLLLAGHEEDLQNRAAAGHQIMLERVDLVVACTPLVPEPCRRCAASRCPRNGAVENADPAILRQLPFHAPQIIMLLLLVGGGRRTRGSGCPSGRPD